MPDCFDYTYADRNGDTRPAQGLPPQGNDSSRVADGINRCPRCRSEPDDYVHRKCPGIAPDKWKCGRPFTCADSGARIGTCDYMAEARDEVAALRAELAMVTDERDDARSTRDAYMLDNERMRPVVERIEQAYDDAEALTFGDVRRIIKAYRATSEQETTDEPCQWCGGDGRNFDGSECEKCDG